jgi:hypothetical protein
MTVGEARFRRIEGISEGDTVSVFHGHKRVVGVVEIVGWRTGTYKVRVGRRKHHVSMTQVRKVEP